MLVVCLAEDCTLHCRRGVVKCAEAMVSIGGDSFTENGVQSILYGRGEV